MTANLLADQRHSFLPEQLRKASERVVMKAKHVQINDGALLGYVENEISQRKKSPEVDAGLMNVGDTGSKIAFILVRDAINFGSGLHPFLRKKQGCSGARTIGWLLHDHFVKHGPLSPLDLTKATPDFCAKLFDQQRTGPAFELMKMFSIALNEFGGRVIQNFSGHYGNMLSAAEGHAQKLVQVLWDFPHWRDVASYSGIKVPFMKRAQLAAYGLHLATKELGGFEDIGKLTIFADNLIPHVLRVDGLIMLQRETEIKIERGNLIPSGCDEEIEIRAAAVHVCEKLCMLSKCRGSPIMPLELSSWLWKRGQSPIYKARPRHRTVCYAY